MKGKMIDMEGESLNNRPLQLFHIKIQERRLFLTISHHEIAVFITNDSRCLIVALSCIPVISTCTMHGLTRFKVLTNLLTIAIESKQQVIIHIHILQVLITQHGIRLLVVYSKETFFREKPHASLRIHEQIFYRLVTP